MTTEPTAKHQQEARELATKIMNQVAVGAWQFCSREWNIENCAREIALALSSRDAEKLAICGDGDRVGGCSGEVLITDSFRCADCLAWFHRDCINEHFALDAYVKKLRELREQGAIDDWKEEVATAQAALRTRDTEIREVLEGLRVYWTDGGCWCRNKKYRPRIHDDACLAVRGLWERVQDNQSSSGP